MSTQLIAHLKKKCEADDNVKILLSQWEFDQKLVGKALENIGGFYPHFSNHNASHSQQILVNIERLLGDDIDLLSATDTWLILEAAYWHDVGMLVDAEKAKKVHDEENFKKMLREIVQNKSSDLYEFAKVFLNDSWQGAIALEKHPFDGVEKYRQLIAEYFRKEHANRIGSIVLEDYKNLGINTPRTELLPTRLFRYLGNICVGHGMNFDKMMEVLPRCQTGLGTEDCHPLFVACLLRLGDLFDLDDNRFCPVMAKHVSNMPSVSKHHHDKHLSLREFQLDKRTVKLVAECPNEMSYVETQNWFGWIREEFQNQMSQWNLIVPSLKFGSLPTIEQLDVRMQGNRILLSKKPMKFTIDEHNAMEILQGANLYKNELSIFRELIQNSIDATMIKIYLLELKNKDDINVVLPTDSRMKKLFEENKIVISIYKKERLNDKEIWSIKIQDKGTGISIDDLSYMQKMAGSSKNFQKIKIIQEMPKWMRPSGEFGIGLHSTFLLTKNLPSKYQVVNYKTKSIFTNECHEINMNSPLGDKGGYCFISKLKDENLNYGTTVEVNFSINEKSHYDKELYLSRKNIYVEDFNLMSSLIIWKFYKRLLVIISTSILKIEIKAEGMELFPKFEEYFKYYNKGSTFYEQKLNFCGDRIWFEKENLFFKINKLNISKYQRNSHFEDSFSLFFKGQRASSRASYIYLDENSLFSFFSFEIDFYGLNAKNVLNINRDSWNSVFVEEVYSNFFNLLNELYDEKQEEISKMLGGGFYQRLFEFHIGKINFEQLFTNEDINSIFGEDIMSKNVIFFTDRVDFLKDSNSFSSVVLYNKNDSLEVLLKKYFFNKGMKIYSVKYQERNGYSKICISSELDIKDIVLEECEFYEEKPWGNGLSFTQSVLNAFVIKYPFIYESIFYLYIELSNMKDDFDKDFYSLILMEKIQKNRILIPFYIYKNKLISVDLEDFVTYLIDNKRLSSEITYHKVMKIYQKLNSKIEEIMKNTEIWKTLNQYNDTIKFIDE